MAWRLINTTATALSNERGSVAILASIFMAVGLGVSALAVDVGSLYTERRALQGVADIAASAGATDIGRAEAAVAATFEANQITAAFTVERGRYQADPATPSYERFKVGVEPFNAIRLNVKKRGQLYFGRFVSDGTFEIEVEATAASAAMATFSVGSRLAAVRAGVANKVLGALIGTDVSLSVMDYDALASAQVNLADFLTALATRGNITAVSYNELLASSFTFGSVVAAAATAAEGAGDLSTAATLRSLATMTSNISATAPISGLLTLGPLSGVALGQKPAGLAATVPVMNLISSTALLAGGARQVHLDLTAAVPGTLGITGDLAVGEKLQYASTTVGQPEARVRTAQTRLRLVAETDGTGLLSGIRLRLPVYVDAAYAEARLTGVACGASNNSVATIGARSGVARASIGEVPQSGLGDFRSQPVVSPAKIVDTPLIQATGRAAADFGSNNETLLEFNQTDVAMATVKRTTTTSASGSIATSLAKTLVLDVRTAGLVLSVPGDMVATLSDAVSTMAKPLDAVLFDIFATMGIAIGEADVRVHRIVCGGAVLAG